MDLRLRVTTTSDTYDVTTTPLVLIRWERKMKSRVSALGAGDIGLEDLAVMAYEASRVAGRTVPANFDEWLGTIRSIEPVGDETPDPTDAAPSDD